MLVVFAIAYSLSSTPGKFSKSKIQETVVFGAAKRMSMLMHLEFKKAQRVLFPSKTQMRMSYCVLQAKDGKVNQFFFDNQGNFCHRQAGDKKHQIVIRHNSKQIFPGSFRFEYRGKGLVAMYLSYKTATEDDTVKSMEYFDTFAIQK